MVERIGPRNDQSGTHESIGIPGYLDVANPPGYGVADSNGYIGVDQDHNSHANAVDRPGPSSVQLGEGADAAEEEGDLKFAVGLGDHDGPQLADGDGNKITDDNDHEADNERVVKSDASEVTVNHLGRNVEDAKVKSDDDKKRSRKSSKPAAKKATPPKPGENS
jgi:hypothetical protein